MTDTMTSQNTDLSFLDTLYNTTKQFADYNKGEVLSKITAMWYMLCLRDLIMYQIYKLVFHEIILTASPLTAMWGSNLNSLWNPERNYFC
jgi:hypothetical protein